MKKRMEQIEEILSCEENSAGVRLKELVEALELEVTNQNLLKVTSILHMNPKFKKEGSLIFLYMKKFPVQISHIYHKETIIRKEKPWQNERNIR